MDTTESPLPTLASRAPSSGARVATAERPLRARGAELVGLALIVGQVGLIALIMRQTGLEHLAFRRAVYIAAAGFVLNHLLPDRLRPRFFAFLSCAGLVVILGGTLESRVPDLALGLMRTGTLLAAGALLVGICHLAIRFWIRVFLLAAAGAGLAMFRTGEWTSGQLAVVWPVLGSMFMFRVMVYLYDRSASPVRQARSHGASYFFLFPNASALLFPVIDFRTFAQKYYDEEAFAIYQRGVRWMARGVVHLLLYRLVDRLLLLEPASVSNGAELVQFVVANLFLYLKVSGVFHLVVGLLLLFGFNLPETNQRYFLASSFTDYWRRVNIYWRAFIMKVFYYPTFFRFKSWGQPRALTVATLWAFFVTWALHLYQTWWIKGSVSWSWPDTLFWSSLAVLVLVNSLWELKRNRQRKLASGHYSIREAAGLALRTAATFSVIAVLWSLWSTPSVGQWLQLWSHADRAAAFGAAGVLAAVMIAAIAFEVLPKRWAKRTKAGGAYLGSGRFRRDVLVNLGVLLALYGVSHPGFQRRIIAGESKAAAEVGAVLMALRQDENAGRGQERGYYENLTSMDEGSGQYFEAMNPGRGRRYSQPAIEVPGVYFRELAANTQFTHHDWSFATNRWGMRDRDYELTKPPGTLRLAMLGSSQVMGYGLTDDDRFEAELERQLNAAPAAGSHEILNFAIGGLSPPGQVWLLQARVPRFEPDMVIFIAHPNDFEWTTRDIARLVRKRASLPPRFPSAILEQARVGSGTPEVLALTRLRRFEQEVLAAVYADIVSECRTIGAVPVYVFLPVPMDLPLDPARTALQLRLAEQTGFVVLDLAKVFAGEDPQALTLRDEGRHINARGNAIIAEALYKRLTEDRRIDLANAVRRQQANAPAKAERGANLP